MKTCNNCKGLHTYIIIIIIIIVMVSLLSWKAFSRRKYMYSPARHTLASACFLKLFSSLPQNEYSSLTRLI